MPKHSHTQTHSHFHPHTHTRTHASTPNSNKIPLMQTKFVSQLASSNWTHSWAAWGGVAVGGQRFWWAVEAGLQVLGTLTSLSLLFLMPRTKSVRFLSNIRSKKLPFTFFSAMFAVAVVFVFLFAALRGVTLICNRCLDWEIGLFWRSDFSTSPAAAQSTHFRLFPICFRFFFNFNTLAN